MTTGRTTFSSESNGVRSLSLSYRCLRDRTDRGLPLSVSHLVFSEGAAPQEVELTRAHCVPLRKEGEDGLRTLGLRTRKHARGAQAGGACRWGLPGEGLEKNDTRRRRKIRTDRSRMANEQSKAFLRHEHISPRRLAHQGQGLLRATLRCHRPWCTPAVQSTHQLHVHAGPEEVLQEADLHEPILHGSRGSPGRYGALARREDRPVRRCHRLPLLGQSHQAAYVHEAGEASL